MIIIFSCNGSSLLEAGFPLVAVRGDNSLAVERGLLIAAASLVAEHGLYGARA